MILQGQVDTPEVIGMFKNAYNSNEEEQAKIRQKLYKHLFADYERLRKLVSLRQLHFHLPDNRSFLRMHRPSKFGDDLTQIRPTVAYVNKNKKSIDGFETGRVLDGFRFVYPLFDAEKNYLGSVEVSFSIK